MSIHYAINPDRNKPWNTIPELPLNVDLYRDIDVLEQLVLARASLARLQGRSIAIPNQGLRTKII